MYHTTFRVCIDVDEDAFCGQSTHDDLVSAFKAAPVRVAAHPAPAPPLPACSVVRLRASLLHRPLWDTSDETAQRNWSDVLLPDLQKTLPKVAADLQRCSQEEAHRETPLHLLDVPRFELQIDPYVLSFECPAPFQLPDCVTEATGHFRKLLASDQLNGDDVLRVDIPFIDYDALWEQWDARAEREAIEGDRTTSEGEAPSLAAAGEDASESEGAAETLDAAGAEAEDLLPDYSRWGIALRDGNYQVIDSGFGA